MIYNNRNQKYFYSKKVSKLKFGYLKNIFLKVKSAYFLDIILKQHLLLISDIIYYIENNKKHYLSTDNNNIVTIEMFLNKLNPNTYKSIIRYHDY